MLARIDDIRRHRDGSATLILLPVYEQREAITLTLIDAPKKIKAAIGTTLWLGYGIVMVDGQQELWARVVPKTENVIRLVNRDERDKWSWADVFEDASW